MKQSQNSTGFSNLSGIGYTVTPADFFGFSAFGLIGLTKNQLFSTIFMKSGLSGSDPVLIRKKIREEKPTKNC